MLEGMSEREERNGWRERKVKIKIERLIDRDTNFKLNLCLRCPKRKRSTDKLSEQNC